MMRKRARDATRRIAFRIASIALFAMLAHSAVAVANSFQDQLDRAGVAYQVPPTGKAILVNIPSFELIAFSDGSPVLRSRVIVGAPWHRTPRLQTFVSAVRFRPTWRPTPSMIASGEYRDKIWPAGENNPLGLAAVRLAPGLLVYLHDTNRRDLFSRENRALSHGCIRVEHWAALVAFVLDMDPARVHELAYGTRTFDAPAPPIPVELGYFTRLPDASGQIISYRDIYNLKPDLGVRGPSDSEEVITCAEAT